MEKLTVLISTKDERRNIRSCIDSVQDLADEVLVADSGSTDGTIEIVQSIGGCRMIEREYVRAGDFKNWAIPQARHPWVLLLDADERVTPQLRDEIRNVLARDAGPDGYWIRRANYFMGYRVRYGPWGTDAVFRLFRRHLARYAGDTDHAEIDTTHLCTGRLTNRLTHFACWSYDDFLPKQDNYSAVQASLWRKAGRQPSYLRLYLTAFLRFTHIFVVRGGFLDGAVGFQVASLIAYSSFQKQARLWQLVHGHRQPDPEQHQKKAA
jgi:(heptosyl)LPS beta-1,4-glucosyltransferase